MLPEKILKLYTVGALTTLAIAYGDGQIILQDYKNNINRILDNYEKEFMMLKNPTDSIINDSTATNKEQKFDINF